MSSSSFAIGDFKLVLPPYERSQEELVQWITRCHQAAANVRDPAITTTEAQDHALKRDGHLHGPERKDLTRNESALIEKLFRRYSVSSEKIAKRSFECSDLESDPESSESWQTNRIYRFKDTLAEGSSIRERMDFFSERAQAVFENIYPERSPLPDHLIHVTCTGYVSPSAAQLKAAGHSGVAVTHAYHMGCYAALPAVRMAYAFASASRKKDFAVDVVHTEMCGLHMNASNHTPEQIVVQTLFADGHIKYSIKNAELLQEGFRILNVYEEIVPDSATDMSWVPAPWGMQMTLSREVPQKIAASLRPFLEKILAGAGENENLNLSDIIKNAIFAVHPGGPKIIESVRNTLELSTHQTLASEKILRERGNMSSATLPHVWDEILRSNPKPGTKIVSLAFGPGLTLFGAVFETL